MNGCLSIPETIEISKTEWRKIRRRIGRSQDPFLLNWKKEQKRGWWQTWNVIRLLLETLDNREEGVFEEMELCAWWFHKGGISCPKCQRYFDRQEDRRLNRQNRWYIGEEGQPASAFLAPDEYPDFWIRGSELFTTKEVAETWIRDQFAGFWAFVDVGRGDGYVYLGSNKDRYAEHIPYTFVGSYSTWKEADDCIESWFPPEAEPEPAVESEEE